MTDQIMPQRFLESAGVEDWRVLGEGACTYFRTGSFAVGARLVHAIGGWPALTTTIPTSTCGMRA